MRRLDELHLRCPVYGSPRLTAEVRREHREVNEKSAAGLMRVMGLEAIHPKKATDQPTPGMRSTRIYCVEEHHRTGSGLVCRRNARAHALRFHVSGGGDGSVEPLRPVLTSETRR